MKTKQPFKGLARPLFINKFISKIYQVKSGKLGHFVLLTFGLKIKWKARDLNKALAYS